MSDHPAPDAAASKILIVDGDAQFGAALARDLRARGSEIVTVADGDEAIRKAQGKDIGIILLGMEVPKGGGFGVLSAVKALDPTIEVIMVTKRATIDNAVHCMQLGAYDFVTKPVAIDALARIIARAWDKRRMSHEVAALRQVNRSKSEFCANMSHELRTPLNAIVGYTALFLERVYGEVTPKQEEILKRVESAGNHLLQSINSVLDLSKMAAGQMSVYLENFSLKELSAEILELMEGLARAKKLKLEWNMAGDVRLRSDRTMLKKILVNLISNAIKFTSAGGVFIDVEHAPKAARLQLSVRDTGIGIRDADIRRLFQEFVQLDSSANREYGGTGLGLVISKKFAELLGGTIAVTSVAGAGSVFTVVLPLPSLEAEESAAVIAPAPTAGKGGNTLLAIDDDPEVLNLLRDSLHGTGYGFAGALTGEEGIAMARVMKPMAITLDVMMPHRDGWAVLQILKNDPELRSIPVIMVSLLDNKNLGFALGVTAYMVKPFNRAELLAKLQALERGGASPQSPPSEIAMDPFHGG